MGVRLRLRLGKEEQEVMEKEGEVQGEVLLVPEQNLLDAQANWRIAVEGLGRCGNAMLLLRTSETICMQGKRGCSRDTNGGVWRGLRYSKKSWFRP